jgi:predicted amino acid racemase
MGNYPRLSIDLKKIEHNTKIIANLALKQNINITGVTKCCCGDPKVGQAMLIGGAESLADSRVENLKRLRNNGIDCELILLRTPMLSSVKDVVKYSDISLNSDFLILKSLSKEAKKIRKIHKIVIMVEMGDLREGVPRDKLYNLLVKSSKLRGIKIHGLGMNLACYGGVIPTENKLIEFSNLVDDVENEFGFPLQIISGGNSANIPLLLNSKLITRVNNLRIGEGILLGLETVDRTKIPNTYQNAFILEGEIIELYKKHSIPDGKISQNAFGETPEFNDVGEILRGIIAVGRQDVIVEGLKPMDTNVTILGSSSDHIIVRIDSSNYQVGNNIKFQMDYGGLLHLCTSQYVEKKYITKKASIKNNTISEGVNNG